MESKSKKTRIPFRPYPPEIARELAKRVSEVCADTGHILTNGETLCTICNHPNRMEIDFLILTHAPIKKRQAALGEEIGPKWTYARFEHHRDTHLLPAINGEVVPSIRALKMLPHPHGGTKHERARWYFLMAYGIFLDSLEKESPTRALSALREMQELDFGPLSEPLPPKPAEPPAETPAQLEPPDRSKLFGAFNRSKVKQVEEYEIPKEEDEDGEA